MGIRTPGSPLRRMAVLMSLCAVAWGLSGCGDSENTEPSSSTATSLPDKADSATSSLDTESSALQSPTAEDVTEAFLNQLPQDVAGSPEDAEPTVDAQTLSLEGSAVPSQPLDKSRKNDSASVTPAAQRQEIPSEQPPLHDAPAPDIEEPEENRDTGNNVQVIDPNMPNIPSPLPGR